MPKTNFVDGDPSQGILGTVVTADFINTLNKHYHTGLDQDGHGALPYAADVGMADAYVVNLDPPLTSYVSGMPIFFKAASTNTGPATVRVNTLGVIPIKKNTSQDLAAGDIQAGQTVMAAYDGVNCQMLSTPGTVSNSANADSLTMQGEASAENASQIALSSPGAYISVVSLDLGNVTTGDRIVVEGKVYISGTISAGIHGIRITQDSGSATTQFVNSYPDIRDEKYETQSHYQHLSTICKVTGTGTLTLQVAAAAQNAASVVNGGMGEIYAFFLKKQ